MSSLMISDSGGLGGVLSPHVEYKAEERPRRFGGGSLENGLVNAGGLSLLKVDYGMWTP